MKRKTFIKISLSLLFLSFVGYLLGSSFTKTIENIIKKETDKLNINQSDVARFINEAAKEKFFIKFNRLKKALVMVHFKFRIFSKILPFRNKYVQYKSQFVGHFLLSTDFFRNGMDVEKDIVYMDFYNPYKQPCSNPFSSIYYPEKS